MNLMDLVATLKLNADEYLRGIDQAMSGFDQFKKQFDDANKGFEAWASSAISAGAALTAGLTVPIAGTGVAALSMASDFEQAEIAFTTMLGSAKESKSFLDELKAFAASTPFEFPELQDAAKKMMALGFESQTVIPIMRTIGDAVAGLGGNSALIDRITLQLGQMQAKGKVAASEMKTLAEAGIPAWQLLADKIGKDIPTAMAMAEKGAITAAEAIPAILEGMTEKFGGMMAKQSQTAAGQFSNMKDQITFILADLGKALLPFATMVLEFAKPMLEAVKFLVDGFAALPMPIQTVVVGLAALAAAIGPVLVAMGLFTQGILAIGPLLGTTGIYATLSALAGILGPIALAVAAVAAAWGLWQLEPVQSALKSVWDTLTGFYDTTLKPFLSALADGATAFATFAASVISSGLQAAWDGISAAASTLWDWLKQVWSALGDLASAFGNALSSLSPLLSPLADLAEWLGKVYVILATGGLIAAWEVFKAVLGFVGGLLLDLAKILGGVLLTGLKGMASFVDIIGDALNKTLKPALVFVIDKISDLIDWLKKIPGVKSALDAVNGAFDKIKTSVSGATSETKKLNTETDKAKQATTGATDSAKKYSGGIDEVRRSLESKTKATGLSAEETKNLEAEHKKTETAVRNTSTALQGILTHLDKSKGSVNDLRGAHEKLESLQAKLTDQFGNTMPPAIKAMWLQIEIAQGKIADLQKEAEKLDLEQAMKKADAAVLQYQTNLTNYVRDHAGTIATLTSSSLAALDAANAEWQKNEEAFARVVGTSRKELESRANQSEQDYARISQAGERSAEVVYQAEKKMLESRIALYEATGQAVSQSDRDRLSELEGNLKGHLENIESATKDSAEKQKSVWGDFTKQVSTIFSDFAKNVTERIWDAFSGKGNDELARQRADLEQNLAERTADWEAYQQEVAASLEEITRTHAEALAEEIADLNAALEDKRQDYYDYVASVNEKLTEIRQSHAEELEEERQDLLAKLAEKLEAYEEYASEVSARVEEIKTSHAEKLAEELADLQDSLNDKSRAYSQYVQDVNRKLARIGQDLEEQIDDETRETNRGIEDRRRAYSRYEADIIEKINNELAKGKDANQQQIADWRESLAERREDLEIYLQRAAEDLEEFKSDAQRRAAEEEEDLKLSLQRRTEEHARYVAEIGARAGELTARHREEEAEQIADLIANLNRRRQEYERYAAETQRRIDEATRKHNEQQAKEEADLMASFNRRTAEWERYQRENAAKIEAATRKHAEQQAKEEADLAASLARRQQEYEQYLAEVQAGIADLQARHQSFAESLGSLFTGVLSDLGQALTRFGVEYIEGVLWKKLKEVGTDILPELKDAFLAVFKKDGIIWNAIGDLFDWIGGLFKKTKDAIIGVGQEGLNQLAGWGIGGTGTAAGAAGSAGAGAGSAGGAGAAAGSGLAGVVGAIGSVASAISGIVGNFQMHGMNKSLDLIEESTRYVKIDTQTIVNLFNRYLPKLEGFENFNYNVIASSWFDLLSHLDTYMPRFATALETDIPSDLTDIYTSVENTKGTIENMRDTLAEKLGNLVSGFGDKLAAVSAGFKTAIDLSTSNLQSTLREIVNSDTTSRTSITSALSMLGGDVRNVQNAIFQTNMSGAMLSELGMIRGELTQIKSLSQNQLSAKPSQITVNVQAPVGTASPQNFGYVAASALKSQFGTFF